MTNYQEEVYNAVVNSCVKYAPKTQVTQMQFYMTGFDYFDLWMEDVPFSIRISIGYGSNSGVEISKYVNGYPVVLRLLVKTIKPTSTTRGVITKVVEVVKWWSKMSVFDDRWSELFNHHAKGIPHRPIFDYPDVAIKVAVLAGSLGIKTHQTNKQIVYNLLGNQFKIVSYHGNIRLKINDYLILVDLKNWDMQMISDALFPIHIQRELKLKQITDA